MKNGVYNELREHIDGIWVVDTHEHMCGEKEWLAEPEARLNFSQLMHYIDLDVISSGMSFDDMRIIRFEEVDEDKKWEVFEPFWEKTKNTAFAKMIIWTCRDIYGIPDLNRDTYKAVGAKIREMRKPGHYRKVLKEQAKIEISINDCFCLDADPEFFLPSIRLDQFIIGGSRKELQALEKNSGVSVGSLGDLIGELEKTFASTIEAGAVAIKSAQAYTRGLEYDYHTRDEAEKAFARASGSEDADPADAKTVSDFMFYRLAELCGDRDIPMQIHTGMAAGDAKTLRMTNPILLSQAVSRNPKTRFDLFHAGYPYWREMGVMVKNNPNVCADLCWAHILSPTATRNAFREWIEMAPANKIFAFGGDLGSPDIAVVHIGIARKNIAKSLADMVEDDYMSMGEAKRIAEMVFRDNAAEFFKLNLGAPTSSSAPADRETGDTKL